MSRLSPRQLAAACILLAVGVGIRCWIAFTNYGVAYDTTTWSMVAHLLATHPLHAYSSLRYPYPGGFLPVLLLCHRVARSLQWPFWAVCKLPAILGDLGIAVVLLWGLGHLGASARERLLTVALVALGPIFVIVSGFHGQLDPVAILPALVGVIVWSLGGADRGWQSGLLVGLAAAIKTVPLFMVLAMLPTARSRREAATLLVCSIAVPLVSVLPFLLADPHHTFTSLTSNVGVPGIGGLSVLVQPSLLQGWLHGHLPPISGATLFFAHRQNAIVAAGVLLAGIYAWRRRMDPISAAVLIWTALYVVNFNWAFQYWIWGLPFFLLARRQLETAALQALLLIPAVELYFHFDIGGLGWAVFPLTTITWCALALVLVALTRGRPAPRHAGQLAIAGVPAPAREHAHPVTELGGSIPIAETSEAGRRDQRD